MSKLKFPRKGAVARLRELYDQRRDEIRAKAKEQIQQELNRASEKSVNFLAKRPELTNRTVNSTIYQSGGSSMDRTNADQFRTNMKEWMESARKEPIKITRKSGESFVLVSSEVFEKMQLDLARLEGLTASLVDVAQGRTSRSTEKSTIEIFEKAKKRALTAKKSKKVAG